MKWILKLKNQTIEKFNFEMNIEHEYDKEKDKD